MANLPKSFRVRRTRNGGTTSKRQKTLLDGTDVQLDSLDSLAVAKISAFLSRGDRKDCLDAGEILKEAQKTDGDLSRFTPWLLSETRERDCMADDISYILTVCAKTEDLYGVEMGSFRNTLIDIEYNKKKVASIELDFEDRFL